MPANDRDRVQGEGNYDAAKEFNDAEEAFVKSGKVEKAAGKAQPSSPADEEELRRAEQAGRARAKGKVPAVRRPPKPAARSKDKR